jgi:hypothetical protein
VHHRLAGGGGFTKLPAKNSRAGQTEPEQVKKSLGIFLIDKSWTVALLP